MSKTFKVSEEVLKKCKKKLLELTNSWDARSTGLCHGDVYRLSGDYFCESGHGACHSWVTAGGQFRGSSDSALVLNCHPRERCKCKRESADAYALWLARESPFSRFILNRDDTDSLLNGGLIIYTGGKDGATINETLWICKSLRYATEGAKALDVWKELVDEGVDPLLSVVVCTFVSNIKNRQFYPSSVTTHCAVFLNYIGQAPCDAENLLRRHHNPDANSSYTLYGKENAFIEGATFADFCKPVIKDDGWGGKITSLGSTKDYFIQEVLKWENTIREEHGIPKNNVPNSSTVYLDVDL